MDKKPKWILISIGAVLLLIILSGLSFYFTQINNAFVNKPDIPKPGIDIDYLLANPGVQVIFGEHITYVTNELGSYKLHDSGGENAVIVFYMADIDTELALIQDYADSEVTDEIPDNYDIRISGDQIHVAELIESDNLGEEMSEKVEAGDVQVEIVSDMGTLALKGYLGIYEELF